MSTLDILDRLIGFDTVSARSNLAMVDFIETFLADRGFAITRIPDPTGEKAGLYATLGPAGEGVLLSGHTDVVPTDGQDWTRPAFKLTRENDRLFGRGTTDMKGFVACMLTAADRAAKADLKAPLSLALSYDEEIGCVGVQQMESALAPLIGQPRLCIVGEPTVMQVTTGHKGKAMQRVVCTGQAGHSALAPKFVNALHMASDFITAMRALQDDLRTSGVRDAAYDIPYSTIHVGTLTGGKMLNIVADQAEMMMEFRHLAADPAEALTRRIRAAADQIAADYRAKWGGAAITVEQVNAYPGLDVGADAPAIALAQTLAETNTTTKVAFGTEAGVFATLGVPTIVCGPGSMEGQGHKPDEYITTEQLSACERMLERAVDALC